MTTNVNRLAHDALDALLASLFSDAPLERNPGGHTAPKPRVEGQLASYVAMIDDNEPEVLGAMCGQTYDLKSTPTVVIAFAGGTKDARTVAAYERLDALTAALALDGGDPTLSGTVDFSEIDAVEDCDAEGGAAWMAGGLTVRIGLLFTGRTKAG